MKIKYNIIGLDCPNCAAKLAARMESKDGIDSAKINFLTEKLTVETTLDEKSAYDVLAAEAKAFSKGIAVTYKFNKDFLVDYKKQVSKNSKYLNITSTNVAIKPEFLYVQNSILIDFIG